MLLLEDNNIFYKMFKKEVKLFKNFHQSQDIHLLQPTLENGVNPKMEMFKSVI